MTEQPPTQVTIDEALVRASLAHQYQGVPGLLSICSDADGWAGRRFTTDEAGIAAAVQYAIQLDRRKAKGIYAQVTTLRERPKEGRGGKDLAHGLTFLWADGDFGNVGHKPGPDEMSHPEDADHVREIVASSGLPEPSGWVLSGGGFNPMWMLDQAHVITDDDRARIEGMTSGLQAILGAAAYGHGCTWDTEIGNLDRLMRVPGTVNRKAGQARATGSVPGSAAPVPLGLMFERVAALEPGARAALEKAAAEKRARQDVRTGRPAVPPPRARAVSNGGSSVFDILAANLTFRDILEPAGWTYRGTSGGRDKWLRPASSEGSAESDYSLICDDHVAVNWSERSGLPVGQQPSGRKLTVPTLWAHLHYSGNEPEAARDVLRAAYDQPCASPARGLSTQILLQVKQRCRPPRQEPRDVVPPLLEDSWDALEEPEPEHGRPDQDPGQPQALPGLLPETFWSARPELRQIRQAAHSRNRSGDVAFYSTLTRLSALVPHHIRADTGVADFVSLNLFVALVGPSGSGKSTGVRVSKRLLVAPPTMDFRDGLPIGSGEGMAEVFMGTIEEETGEIHKGGPKKGDPVTATVRAQVRHNAFFYIDEGASLTRLMKERTGSTLGETLRSAAVGQTLGQTNASKDNSRYIPGGSYSMGLLVGFQPETAAPLFDDTAEGTPQRFLWGVVTDPSIPDEPVDWPGELLDWRAALDIRSETLITFDKTITTELRRVDLANARGEKPSEDVGPLDSHAPVMKIKVASLLAILAGRLHVTVEDWALAETVWLASCAARNWVIAYSERQRKAEAEKRTQARITEEVRLDHAKLLADDARTDKAVDRLATRLALLVHEAGPASRSALRTKVAGRDKKHVADALNLAALRGWLDEADGKLTPGRSRPS
ncbi:hypothetical protein ACFW9O_05835 [Streptomyces sp. NPDC059499]|uniref:hypothetical protein n=1 Tax=Streptomyces sp. NPDC059499 TaxID=3346852 RepID=UPI0036A8FB93